MVHTFTITFNQHLPTWNIVQINHLKTWTEWLQTDQEKTQITTEQKFQSKWFFFFAEMDFKVRKALVWVVCDVVVVVVVITLSTHLCLVSTLCCSFFSSNFFFFVFVVFFKFYEMPWNGRRRKNSFFCKKKIEN